MRTSSSDPPRRPAARMACGLALVLALAHGTTGCAHQLTNAELAYGVVMVVGVAALAVTLGSCNELTMQCKTPEGHVIRPGPSFPSALVLPHDGAPR
jgi:hypothetical protein